MEYKIHKDDIVKVLEALDEIPYKYVKEIIPYLEKSLTAIKDNEYEEIQKEKSSQ